MRFTERDLDALTEAPTEIHMVGDLVVRVAEYRSMNGRVFPVNRHRLFRDAAIVWHRDDNVTIGRIGRRWGVVSWARRNNPPPVNWYHSRAEAIDRVATLIRHHKH